MRNRQNSYIRCPTKQFGLVIQLGDGRSDWPGQNTSITIRWCYSCWNSSRYCVIKQVQSVADRLVDLPWLSGRLFKIGLRALGIRRLQESLAVQEQWLNLSHQRIKSIKGTGPAGNVDPPRPDGRRKTQLVIETGRKWAGFLHLIENSSEFEQPNSRWWQCNSVDYTR